MKPVALADIVNDARPGFASGKSAEDGVIQVRMNNVNTEGRLAFDAVRRVPRQEADLSRFAVRPGDILFNATNSPELVGKSALFRGYAEPVVYSNHFLRLRLDPDRADPGYVSRWLQAKRAAGVFTAMCKQWVNQAAVPTERLMAMPVPLPALTEQRRIAAILDEADALRAKRRAALAQLDEMARAIFVEMFGNPLVNPKSLPLVPLGQIGSLDRGVSRHRPRNAPELLGGPYPFVQTGDVSNSDGYIRTFQATYSEIGLGQSRMWPSGTLCITIAANIARVGILTFDACFPDSVVGFIPALLADAEYVRVWFSFAQQAIEHSAPESTQKNINLAILRAYPVPLPPSEQREAFAARLKALQVPQDAAKRAIACADSLFASLQHRAFRGEL